MRIGIDRTLVDVSPSLAEIASEIEASKRAEDVT
jgi:hypothetical protein